MMQQVTWPSRDDGPFSKIANRQPLRLTFHTESFARCTQEEREIIEQLRKLSEHHNELIAALDTQLGTTFPYLRIGTRGDGTTLIPVTTERNGELVSRTGIQPHTQWQGLATQMFEGPHIDTVVEQITEALEIAQASAAAASNLLITASPVILAYPNTVWVNIANPRSPTEAARLVGLFLRSHSIYDCWTSIGHRAFDRTLFYSVLIDHKMPSLRRFLAACAAKDRDTAQLALSMAHRTIRSFHARDSIGKLFYSSQNYTTLDEMAYHFDYLTLLLAGAFDALARVARRACVSCSASEWTVDFRTRKPRSGTYTTVANTLLSELATHNPALYSVVDSQPFQDFMILLYELRNNIHGRMPPFSQRDSDQRILTSYLDVLPQHKVELIRAANGNSTPDAWGLIENNDNLLVDPLKNITEPRQDVLLEPFTYADRLISESMKWIEQIMPTMVSGLLPVGMATAQLPSGPAQNDPLFGQETGQHISYLV